MRSLIASSLAVALTVFVGCKDDDDPPAPDARVNVADAMTATVDSAPSFDAPTSTADAAASDASTSTADAATTGADAGTTSDAGMTGGDAGMTGGDAGMTSGDAGMTGGDAGPTCITGFTTVAETAEEDANLMFYSAEDSATEPISFLDLEVYYVLGATVGPHMFTFTGEGYDACHTCIIVYKDCVSGSGCDKLFMPTGGVLNVTVNADATPGQYTATLSNLQLAEVTIDGSTLATTFVPGGECWTIASHTIDVTTVAPPP